MKFFYPFKMGTVRKSANAHEARQAKLKQMRENYQKRKAERDRLKAEAIANGQEPPKEVRTTRRNNITWDDVPKLSKELQKYFDNPDEEEEYYEYEVLDEPPPFIGPQLPVSPQIINVAKKDDEKNKLKNK